MITTSARSLDTRSTQRLVVVAGLVAFLLLLVRTAWLDDDAYITFRTVDNVLHGYGLRWNVLNRVQSYTHPLWMFAMTAVAAATGDVYYASLLLSGVVSLVAVWLLSARVARSAPAAVLALSAVALSKSYVDYSTSGLENPLTHLLLVGFVLVQAAAGRTARRVGLSALATALLMVNRFDTGLLVLPALAAIGWKAGPLRTWKPLAIGFAPLIVWELFSILYYGFPFPNTAYSKLSHGIARPELLYQGFLYLLDSISNDPLTLLVVVAAPVFAVAFRLGWEIPSGIALYLAYIVWVGGDFMSGRFFTGPFLLALMFLLVKSGRGPVGDVPQPTTTTPFLERFDGRWALALGAVWLVGLIAPRPTIASSAAYGADIERAQAIAATGITDERRYYYPQSGLLNARRGVPMPDHKWLYMGLDARAAGAQVLTTDAAGFIGYAAGPAVYFVDKYGLGDPLISRLPAEAPWRIGHFERRVPDGYLETLRTGRNAIADPGIAEYYEKLRVITEGPLWSRRRLRTIIEMNLGRFDSLIADYGLVRVPIDALATVKAAGTPWNAAGTMTMTPRGVEVSLPARTGGRVELSVSGDDTYRLTFLRGGRPVADRTLAPPLPANGSLEIRVVDAPRAQYDTLRLRPSGGDARYSVGHIRLLGEDES